jgi:hypothetical protein
MQTDPLPEMRASWPQWAEFLRRHGLEGMAAWMLEAAGPVTALGAQMLYLGGPFLRPALKDDQCVALANLLEDPVEAHSFAAFLRKGNPL